MCWWRRAGEDKRSDDGAGGGGGVRLWQRGIAFVRRARVLQSTTQERHFVSVCQVPGIMLACCFGKLVVFRASVLHWHTSQATFRREGRRIGLARPPEAINLPPTEENHTHLRARSYYANKHHELSAPAVGYAAVAAGHKHGMMTLQPKSQHGMVLLKLQSPYVRNATNCVRLLSSLTHHRSCL